MHVLLTLSFFCLGAVEVVLTLTTPSSPLCTVAPPTGQDGPHVEELNLHVRRILQLCSTRQT